MDNKVKLPPDVNSIEFDKLFQTLSKDVESGSTNITIDCCNVKFLDIYSILGLLISANHFSQSRNVHFVWQIPKGNVRSYLGRVNFFQSLSPNSTIWPEIDQSWIDQQSSLHGFSKVLLELIPVKDEDSIHEILDRTENTLLQELQYNKQDTFDVCIMISELCHNIIEHNPPSVIGYASMQFYRPLMRKPYLQVTVGDNGIGIPTSIRKNPHYSDLTHDKIAIEKSMQPDVTEFENEYGRGQGLYRLRCLCAKHLGALTIRSGMGKVFERYSPSSKKNCSFDVSPMSGTLIGMNFEAEAK